VLTPVLALLVLLAWVVVLAATRYVSLASLAAAALLIALRLALTPLPWSRDNVVVTAFCLFGAALVALRHAGNVRRLLQGSEHRLEDSPAMLLLPRTLHVLAVGLWFGTAVYFTVVGLLLFQTFDAISLKDQANRPLWFPLPDAYAKQPPSDKFPDPLRKEQGSRAAGAAVGPIFPWYYGIQAGCGAVAVVTALGWWTFFRGGRVHAIRAVLLTLALAGVAAGWWMEGVVAGLREPRDNLTDKVLASDNPAPELVRQAEAARTTFVTWHGYSLLDNFAVLLLVAVGTALAAQMPAPIPTIDHKKEAV